MRLSMVLISEFRSHCNGLKIIWTTCMTCIWADCAYIRCAFKWSELYTQLYEKMHSVTTAAQK